MTLDISPKAQSREKNDKLFSIKSKTSAEKNIVKRIKGHKLKRFLYTSDKELLSKTYKELLNLSNNKQPV